MSEQSDSRRAFLAGGAGVAAGAVLAPEASAQTGMIINAPDVVQEIATAFAGYDRALGANDVAALNGYFFDNPSTVRYGNAENLYGFAEIAAFRASVTSNTPPQRERTVITTYGRDFATVATLSRRPGGNKIGRTMQTWVRFPQGWRIVAAHVSLLGEATVMRNP